MSIDSLGALQTMPPVAHEEIQVMDAQDMKRILMLGIRGEVNLPREDHEVDVYA